MPTFLPLRTHLHRDSHGCELQYVLEATFGLAGCLRLLSVVHVIRVHAIYDKSRPILGGLSGLFALQVIVMAVCCGFYRCEFPSIGRI